MVICNYFQKISFKIKINSIKVRDTKTNENYVIKKIIC